ncbi:MAG TPA: hypothetical protein VEL11_13700, partial [Candidatus Bathyarchaeia archaeon]|nr:hypothetical protein [Candidatus Bathyarchaeia archaeon]
MKGLKSFLLIDLQSNLYYAMLCCTTVIACGGISFTAMRVQEVISFPDITKDRIMFMFSIAGSTYIS